MTKSVTKYYLLQDKKPFPCTLMEWAQSFNTDMRIIKKTKIKNVCISTVFLGLDHSFQNSGPPIVFETMIFHGKHDMYQERYATYEAALKGHEKAINLVKGDKNDKTRNRRHDKQGNERSS